MATRLPEEYEFIKNELQVCKKKLGSKCEALSILSQELTQCRQERDQFKLMAEQVQQRYQMLKRQLSGDGRTLACDELEYAKLDRPNLCCMLMEMKELNKSLQFEVDSLHQKLGDANGDIKLLREQITRQRVGSTEEGLSTRYFAAHERQDLVSQLEDAKEKIGDLERDVKSMLDEKEDYVTERDSYRKKYERLNEELKKVLQGDEHAFIDIDSIIMENRYLQEKVNQLDEEKKQMQCTLLKYKSLVQEKKRAMQGSLHLGQFPAGQGMVVNHKQVEQLLGSALPPSPHVVTDLQALATGLLEALNDKSLALRHQKSLNKALGTQVAELEKKCKNQDVLTSPQSADKQLKAVLSEYCSSPDGDTTPPQSDKHYEFFQDILMSLKLASNPADGCSSVMRGQGDWVQRQVSCDDGVSSHTKTASEHVNEARCPTEAFNFTL